MAPFLHVCGMREAKLEFPLTREFWFQLDGDQVFGESERGEDDVASLLRPHSCEIQNEVVKFEMP